MGLQAGSVVDSLTHQSRLSRLIMKQYVTFPILLTDRKFSEVRLDNVVPLKIAFSSKANGNYTLNRTRKILIHIEFE